MEEPAPRHPPEPATRTLRRALGPWLLGILVVGDILGAGIYILVGEVAADVGGLVWVPFVVALGLAALTVTSYVELVTAQPHAAGSARWVQVAYGREQVTFHVGFAVAASAVSTAAAVSRAVGGRYLAGFVDLPVVPVAAAVVVLPAGITWVGIAESARANAAMTIIEVAGLLMVAAAGVGGVLAGSETPLLEVIDAGPFAVAVGPATVRAVTGTTRWVRAPDALWRRLPHAAVLLARHGEEPITTNVTGAALWDVLAEPRTLDEAAGLLAEAFGAEVREVAADIGPVIDDLAARGLLVEADPAPQ